MNSAVCTRIAICVCIFWQTLPAQTVQSSSVGSVYVGLLDDAREQMVNWRPGVANERLIRLAFEKTGGEWGPVQPASFPHRVTWTVGFDGKKIGQVTSEALPGEAPAPRRLPHFLTPVQIISTPLADVPSIGLPSENYGPMGMGPTKGRRPLVVVSKPYISDPDGWKRISQPQPKFASLVREAFRRDFPHVSRCKDEVVVQSNWQFPDSALMLSVAYASSKGSYLVETTLDAGDCGYVDDPDDPLSSPWFFITADGKVSRIGSFMTLLDAGDYDNDGRSEIIFMLNQPEDVDGFVLFDANMHKRASLLWTYH
jgi:hypothetical protein